MMYFYERSLPLIAAKVSVGQYFINIIDGQGKIWSAGYNPDGRLGDNSTTYRSQFTAVAKTDVTWKAVANSISTVALDSAGSVWCWGPNGVGQLGNNTIAGQSSPVSIIRSSSYTKIASGGVATFATCSAIDGTNGMVWSWGSNGSGQLGDGSLTGKSSPSSIRRAGSYVAVAVGGQHGAVIDATDGSIWAYGANFDGGLGDNTLVDKSSPVSIVRAGSYVALAAGTAAGGEYNLAIDGSDGSLWAWGWNGEGELGDGTVASRSSPVSVHVAGSFVQVACGMYSSFAIDSAGVAWAWGLNTGNLGDGTGAARSVPVSIATGVASIFPSGAQVLGSSVTPADNFIFITTDGTIKATGTNTYGQFGSSITGTNSPRSTSYNVRKVIGINFGAFILNNDSTIQGIGYNYGGNLLGNNVSDSVFSPTYLARSNSYSTVAGYSVYGGAIDATNGTIWMWGDNTVGGLGDNTLTSRNSPVSIARSASYTKIAVGTTYTSAIDSSNGMVWTWGLGTTGRLGDNTTTTKSSPVSIRRLGSYVAIAAAGSGGAAIDGATGMIWTWGNGAQLGDNTITTKSSPVSVRRLGSYVAIGNCSVAYAAIDASNGMIWTWGTGSSGQLGDNTVTAKSSPVSIARAGSYVAVSAGNTSFFLAIDGSNGSVWAWGSNINGQLGDGTYTNKSSPVSVLINRSCIAVGVGIQNGYAVDYQGYLWAWGDNSMGQLFDGNGPSTTPKSIGKVLQRP